MWKRLHPELSPKPENYAPKKVSKSRRKSHKSRPMKSLERAEIKRKHATLDASPATFPSHQRSNVPPVSGAKGRCRIPKKRYMHDARMRSASELSRADLQCVPKQHLQELPYSESDMSVAMILAGLEGSSSHDSSAQDSVDV